MSWITQRFEEFGERLVAVDDTQSLSYAGFVAGMAAWRHTLQGWGVGAGERVGLVCRDNVEVIALLLALMDMGCVAVPLAVDDEELFEERLRTVNATRLITLGPGAPGPAAAQCRDLGRDDAALHPLMASLVEHGHPGIVIFTSGSTGKGKAVLLDFGRMTRKYRDKVRPSMRTLLFLKLDHIGGLNSVLAVLLNGGTVVTCGSRNAKDICACIQRHAVELLPTTPSFLTMLLMSAMHRHHDLSSLRVITYGTEVMPASTLASLHQAFPGVTLKQTYGLSELGILATKSKDSSSRWMKIGGEGFELNVRDGTLWIRSEQAMLGYLNAPSPFDADGWYNTGDRVEVDGEYFQILGRESEIINVAGEKVFPAEIESFLLTLDNVRDVVVREKKSPVVGQMVWAEFVLKEDEDAAVFKKRVIEQCRTQLAPFKVPGYISISRQEGFVGSRFKKLRKGTGTAAAAPASTTGEASG